jgi:hypothetical protein
LNSRQQIRHQFRPQTLSYKIRSSNNSELPHQNISDIFLFCKGKHIRYITSNHSKDQ